ncbi:MAG: ABC transporter substrate-binding protein [Methanotrichaceae archaeon]
MKSIVLLLAIMLLFFAVAGAERVKPITVTDDMGRIVDIAKAPERIISLAPSNTEILFALGLGNNVVGVTKYCNYPPEVESLKDSGKLAVIGGYIDPDLEKILSLHPDLILATDVNINDIVPALEKAGIPTFVVKSNNLSGILASIRKIGKITGKEAEASTLTSQMESRIKAVSDKVNQLPKKKVLYIVWHDPVQTVGKGTFEDEIIELAGGTNIFHELSGYPQVDPEAIAVRNPEVIIACTGMGEGMDQPFQWAKTDKSLNQTDARHNNRIYEADADIMTRPGPRIVEGLEMFARYIHPEAF